jgi:hypothetical protein
MADSVIGTAADDVWFVSVVSGHQVYQWDGTEWRIQDWGAIIDNVKHTITDARASFNQPPFMDKTGSLWLVAQTPDGPKLFRTDPKPKR